MTKFIAIASGKGGTGKTTVALNLGLSLMNFGREAIVLDANLHSPHIGLHLGSPFNPISLHDVLKGRNHITEAVYSHASGLKIVPLHISSGEIKNTDFSRLGEALEGLKNRCEAVIIDAPNGLGREAEDVFRASHETILVTTPDILSITEALKTRHLAEKYGAKVVGAVVNRVRKDNIEMSVRNIERMLGIPVLEIIPEDESIRQALHMKHPVAYSHPESRASIQFKKLAAKLIGEKYAERLEEEDREGAFGKILKALGFR